MRDQCRAAVSKALGRAITQAEARDIEARVIGAQKLLAARDRKAWGAMTPEQRLEEAGKLAGMQLLHEARKEAERAALSIAARARVFAELKRGKAQGFRMAEVVSRLLANWSDGKFSVQSVESRAAPEEP